MNSFGTTLRILGLIVCGALALFYTGVVLLAMLALVTAGGSGGSGSGRLLGALVADLVFIAVFLRLLRGLRAK